jgi:hypothetical protein
MERGVLFSAVYRHHLAQPVLVPSGDFSSPFLNCPTIVLFDDFTVLRKYVFP